MESIEKMERTAKKLIKALICVASALCVYMCVAMIVNTFVRFSKGEVLDGLIPIGLVIVSIINVLSIVSNLLGFSYVPKNKQIDPYIIIDKYQNSAVVICGKISSTNNPVYRVCKVKDGKIVLDDKDPMFNNHIAACLQAFDRKYCSGDHING